MKILSTKVLRFTLLFAVSVFVLLWSGLIDRWYGQIIGDTFEIRSSLLTEFRKESTSLRAFVVVPIAASEHPERRFPVLYHLHGFGSDYQDAAEQASRLRIDMRRHPEIELIHVFLDVSLSDGYHYFVNSINTGPWENALINEFIPQFEQTFPAKASPKARFLTGHSSGGWSSLWLQIRNPDFFSGVWSVSPDPVDFSDFFGIDLTINSNDNFYKDNLGKDRRVARSGKLKKLNMASYVAEEEEDLDSHCDGDFGSYECAFSPRAENGQARLLFNRQNGFIDKQTIEAWQQFDIAKLLKENWQELGPKLAGKLHMFCGAEDDFFLEKPFIKLCNFFRESGLKDVCELVSGRGHGNIYYPSRSSPQGLAYRIAKEAHKNFENQN